MRRSDLLEELRREVETMGDVEVQRLVPSRRDFLHFTATQKKGVSLIVRLKRADPQTGGAWPGAEFAALARVADEGDAGAIAVCTGRSFGARPGDLECCAAAVTAPLLRDDLCIDARQIYDARLRGADAVIIPAGGVTRQAVVDLVDVAASLHMAAVVEARDKDELAVALSCPHAAIGLNCVAADGFVCLDTTRALAESSPPRRLAIVLAEARRLEELVSMRGIVDAAVVGDRFLNADDAAELVATWIERLA